MNRRLSSRSEAIFALILVLIPLAFLGLIAFLQLYRNAPEAQAARIETLQRMKVVQLAGAVNAAIQDAERGQRGYLITGRDAYVEPYEAARKQVWLLIDELQQETLDKPDQQRRIADLRAAATIKMSELATTIGVRREQGFEAAQAIVETDLGRKTMSEIQANLKGIQDAANERLQAGLARSEKAERQLTVTSVEGGLIAAAALIIGALLLAEAYHKAAASERVLRATLDSVREGVATFGAGDRLLAWNEAFSRILGLPRKALRPGFPLTPESGASANSKLMIAKLADLRDESRRTGRSALVERAFDDRCFEIFHNPAAGGGYITTLLDVTERKRTEEALRQSGKLEALGQMTGGVAHDFNNLLTIVIGSVSMLRGAVGDNAKALERVEMATIAAERGARLTKQLLAFARRQPLQPEIVNLGALMTEALPLIRRAVGEEVEVECVTAAGLWNTMVDPAHFQSAVLNLAINSRDAMPEGGKLTIEVANAALDDAYAARHAEVAPGQYVLFAITDTGMGMNDATKARALDPFFTTKPVGEGTGLGLPQVYGFVKQSGGHIKIYSEIGDGTTVKLYLPRSSGLAVPRADRAASLALTGSETVLLVDDDDVVRATVASMLETLGYKVIAAPGGAEALTVLESGAAIDLLFTDVVMPGPVAGRRLAELAGAMIPGLKVLFTSGYTENAIVHNGRLDPGVELLSKPYDLDRLAAKLRRVLDGAGKTARPSAGADRAGPA